jgi:hypothetical protein
VRFTKAWDEGELVVRLLIDGSEVLRRRTDRPFGSLIITHRLF